jgi:hypothetical protein
LTISCGIGLNSVAITDSKLSQCNGTDFPLPLNFTVAITGQTTEHNISILNSQAALRLFNANLNGTNPFVCQSSSVDIFSKDSTKFNPQCPILLVLIANPSPV